MKSIDYYTKEVMARYEPKTAIEHRERICLGIIRSLSLGAGASVLDVGCGDGFFLNRLSAVMPPGISYHGVDYSADRIKAAEAGSGFHFQTCNLEEGIPFPDAAHDVVYAGEVIEHLYNPDLFLAEAARVLKTAGHLLLSTPNLNSWLNRILFLFGYQPLHVESSTRSSLYGYGFMKRFKKQDWPVGHVRIFNRRSLRDALEDNGFRVITCRGTVFEALPGPLKPPDRLFALVPSLASGLVVLARKSAG